MPVTSIINTISYLTDGFTLSFSFPYYLNHSGELVVFTYDPIGNITVFLILGTDFTLLPNPPATGPYPSGVTVVCGVAPTAGLNFVITRSTYLTQLTEFIDNAPFTAESFNNALDKLTVAIQDTASQFKGIAFEIPTGGLIAYKIGDWFRNAMPVAGGYWGWTCIDGGTPGTWKGFGVIES